MKKEVEAEDEGDKEGESEVQGDERLEDQDCIGEVSRLRGGAFQGLLGDFMRLS